MNFLFPSDLPSKTEYKKIIQLMMQDQNVLLNITSKLSRYPLYITYQLEFDLFYEYFFNKKNTFLINKTKIIIDYILKCDRKFIISNPKKLPLNSFHRSE